MQLDQFCHGEFDYEVKVFTKEHGTGNAYFRKYHTSNIREISYLHNHMIFRDTILFQLGNPLKTTRAVKYGGVGTLIGREIQEPGYHDTPPPPPPLRCFLGFRHTYSKIQIF